MKYKIRFNYSGNRSTEDEKARWYMIKLHLLELPFQRNWDGEWGYLRNWSARRDKNFMETEAHNRKQERDLRKHNLLVYMGVSPLWNQGIGPQTTELLNELEAEGRAMYEEWDHCYHLTNSGRAYLEGRELPEIKIPPYEG